MNPFEMSVLIVALAVLAGVLKQAIGPLTEVWKEHLQSRKALAGDSGPLARIDELEARIQVLEQILTSDGYELKQKFKDLEKD